MANTLFYCPQLTKIPAFNDPIYNIFRFDTTENASVTFDGETYNKKGKIINESTTQWTYAKDLLDDYINEHPVNGIMSLSELATELGITITTDTYNTPSGDFEINISRPIDLYCTWGYVIFTDTEILIRSPIQRGSAVNLTTTGTTTRLNLVSRDNSFTEHYIGFEETLKPYNEAASSNIREMIDGVRKSYEEIVYVKTDDTTGIAGDYFVIDSTNYIVMDKRIEGAFAYYTCVLEVTAGTAVDTVTTNFVTPYAEIFIPERLPYVTMESTNTIVRVNAGSMFKMNSNGKVFYVRENANNDTSVGTVTASTNYYLYCEGLASTGTFDRKKGIYSISTNAPTYNAEKNGWYYGENICLAKLYSLTTTTMQLILIYEHWNPYCREKYYGMFMLSASQTTNFTANVNHIEFNTKVIGNLEISTGSGQANGIVTLIKGAYYKCIANIQANATRIDCKFRYEDDSAFLLGNQSYNSTQCVNYIDLTYSPTNIDIKLEIVNNSSISAVSYANSQMIIEEI